MYLSYSRGIAPVYIQTVHVHVHIMYMSGFEFSTCPLVLTSEKCFGTSEK